MNAPVPTLDIWPGQVIRGQHPEIPLHLPRLYGERMGEHVDAGLATKRAGRRNFPQPGTGKWARRAGRNPDGATAGPQHQSVL